MSNKNLLFQKLGLLLVFMLIGIMISSVLGIVPGLLSGMEYDEIGKNPGILQEKTPVWSLRLLLFANQIFTFLLPTILFSSLFYKKNKLFELGLNSQLNWKHLFGGIFFLIAAYPSVNFLYWINQQLPLADWMRTSEDRVANLLSKLLETDNVLVVIQNVLLIAVTPAICEELIFRGVIQKEFEKHFKNGHLAVWLGAILFSLIHFQFEGFLARVLLGAVLGYLYYWTRNLWVPITIHFVNNLLPIVVLQTKGIDITKVNDNQLPFQWSTLLVSIAAVYLVYYLFFKKKAYHV